MCCCVVKGDPGGVIVTLYNNSNNNLLRTAKGTRRRSLDLRRDILLNWPSLLPPLLYAMALALMALMALKWVIDNDRWIRHG